MADNANVNVGDNVPVNVPVPLVLDEYVRAEPLPPPTMEGFKEKATTATFNHDNLYLFSPCTDVDFLVPSTPRVDNKAVFSTAIQQFQHTEGDSNQLCAYYLSALCAVFVTMGADARQALENIGLQTRDVRIPGDAAGAAIQVTNMVSSSIGNVQFGQLIFCLYKNINTTSYQNFMTKRTQALKAFAGVDSAVDIPPVIDLNKASKIRSMLGSNLGLRRAVLTHLLSGSKSPSNFGQVCVYITRILSWTEMTYMVFIVESLLYARSPVLKDIAVEGEIRALADAFKIIMDEPQPQYFKITADPHKITLLERSKFPTLIAVAQRLRMEEFPSLDKFAKSSAAGAPTVDRLVMLHKTYLNRRAASAAEDAVTFLTNFSNRRHALPPPLPPAE